MLGVLGGDAADDPFGSQQPYRRAMARELVRLVPQPEGKTIAQMTSEERRAFAEALVEGGIFDGVPGIPSAVDDQH